MFKSWAEYFEKNKHQTPPALLEQTIKLVDNREHALDLGAGPLTGAKLMLSFGFKKVTAIDQEPSIKNYRDKIPVKQLAIRIKSFEKLKLPINTYDLISAQYSLPFTSPAHLPALIDQIKKSLKPNGYFCGQFFGPQDDWNTPTTTLCFHSRTEIKSLLKPLEIIYLKEKNHLGSTSDGQPKNWHIFEIICKNTSR